VLHKLPEGFAIASLFMAAGAGRARAVQAGLALGISTMIGVIVTDATPALDVIGLGLSAGVTLYVAASNLVPEFQGKHDWRPQLAFVLGCIVYFVTRSMEGI